MSLLVFVHVFPLWFEEGVAINQEKARRFGADKIVKKAIENKTFIPIPELTKLRLNSNSSLELVELFYAESGSVVNFIIHKLGKAKFSRFCRKLKKGSSFENALKSTYPRFRDLQRLNDDWVKYLKDK